jgi:DNA-binding NarL/FixJ family response regulator
MHSFPDSRSEPYISAAFSSGANAYVSKRYLAADLEAAIKEALSNYRF